MSYQFWKRYNTKRGALAEAGKLRKMGKKAKVVPLKGYEENNFDVFISL